MSKDREGSTIDVAGKGESRGRATPRVDNGFSWSVSRHDCLAACARRYYFSYYASRQDPEIARLKRLSALPLWTGSVVHESIEAFLKENDRVPPLEVQEAFAHSVVHERMVSDWRASEANSPQFRLFEHEYDVPVEVEDKRIAVGIVKRSLKAFFESDTLREALSVGRQAWLTVEDLVSFEVADVKVFLRMDLAYRSANGKAVIVDWKTGRSEGRFNAIQVAAYALFAAEKGWVSSADLIETELAYLAIPRFTRGPVSSSRLDDARAFIVESARNMRSLLVDPDRNLARIEDFPRVDRPQVCRRCNFRRLCFPKGEVSDALSGRSASD